MTVSAFFDGPFGPRGMVHGPALPRPMLFETDLEPDAAMVIVVDRLKMLFAEAGYPKADVYYEATGIWVDGVPGPVKERAFDIVNGSTIADPSSVAAPNWDRMNGGRPVITERGL